MAGSQLDILSRRDGRHHGQLRSGSSAIIASPSSTVKGPYRRSLLGQLASTIDDCLRAFSAGERVRGMDPLVVLSVLAELVRAAVEGH